MIIPVYKPLGASSHQLAAEIGSARGEKATHTGTLDPLAEGVLVVLTGEDRFKKAELSDTKKIYEFEMLCGIATDSFDLLGVPTDATSDQLALQKIEAQLQKTIPIFVGPLQQLQPTFSAGRHDGKSFFDLAKKDAAMPTKHNDITIHSLVLKKSAWSERESVMQVHAERVARVEGDFRQKEILVAWQQHSKNLPKKLPLFSFEATVSKRTYIRALVRDLAIQLGVPATTFSIIRTQNGPYTLADCTTN